MLSPTDHLATMSHVDALNYAHWLELQLVARERELDNTTRLLKAVTAEALRDTEALEDEVQALRGNLRYELTLKRDREEPRENKRKEKKSRS
jgi:hypothetical protein